MPMRPAGSNEAAKQRRVSHWEMDQELEDESRWFPMVSYGFLPRYRMDLLVEKQFAYSFIANQFVTKAGLLM